jgi:hypothetical protein
MSGAKREQELRRAVLQLSQHGDADIGAVLARLDAPQRDRLCELLAELGRTKPAAAPAPEEASPARDLQAFLRRTPSPFAERFETALIAADLLRGTGSAVSAHPRRMTAQTIAVVAAAIASHVSACAPQPREPRPQRAPLLARWLGKRARP